MERGALRFSIGRWNSEGYGQRRLTIGLGRHEKLRGDSSMRGKAFFSRFGYSRRATVHRSPIQSAYSGELTDPTSKLQYLRARWYDPSMGRFINKDTYEGELTNPLSLNLYVYVSNNPLKFIDPSGHSNVSVDIGDSFSDSDKELINQFSNAWYSADRVNDLAGMQAAHDAANLIRLKYVSSVIRYNFLNGGPEQEYTRLGYEDAYNGNTSLISYWDDPLHYVTGVGEVKVVVATLKLGLTVGIRAAAEKIIPWSSKSVQGAANKLLKGASDITVGSRSEAEELFFRLYQGKGYKNTSGMSGPEAKNFFGKKNTYHWDDTIDESGRVVGHGIDNVHGNLPHLQVHNESGDVIRIFFK